MGKKPSYRVEIFDDASSVLDIWKTIKKNNEIKETVYMMDIGNIIHKVNEWKQLFPNIYPRYALKANPDPCLVAVLNAMGVGFDVASKNELWTVTKHESISKQDIIYSHPIKHPDYLEYAYDVGVRFTVFDNRCELDKIKKHAPNSELLIRIGDIGITLASYNIKFGTKIKDVEELLSYAKSLNLNVTGVCIHSMIQYAAANHSNSSVIDKAFSAFKSVFEIAQKQGYNFNTIDLGGGFAHNYNKIQYDIPINVISDMIREAKMKHFPGCEDINLFAEPGRFFCQESSTIVTHVIGKKKCSIEQATATNNPSVRASVSCEPQFYPYEKYEISDDHAFMYYISDGMLHNFTILEGVGYLKYAILKHFNGDDDMHYISTLWGQTCGPTDDIMYHPLPELDIGDSMAFMNCGAYCYSFATEFNGFPKSAFHYYIRESDWKILKNRMKEEDNYFNIVYTKI